MKVLKSIVLALALILGLAGIVAADYGAGAGISASATVSASLDATPVPTASVTPTSVATLTPTTEPSPGATVVPSPSPQGTVMPLQSPTASQNDNLGVGVRTRSRIGLPQACRALTGTELSDCLKQNAAARQVNRDDQRVRGENQNLNRDIARVNRDSNQLKQDLQKKREALKQEVEAKEKMLEDRVKQFDEKQKQQRKALVQDTRMQIQNLEGTLKMFREKKNSLNDTQKAEYHAKAVESLEKQIDNRIALALDLEVQGANSTEVKAFVDLATEKKTELNSTTNATLQRQIIVVVNQAWSDFRKLVGKEMLSVKFESSLKNSADVLAKENDVIATLSQKGYNVSALQSQSAAIGEQLKNATLSPVALRQAERLLAEIRVAEVHLKNSIQRVANNQGVEPLASLRSEETSEVTTNQPMVSVSAEVAASIKQLVDSESMAAAQVSTGSPTPSAG